MKIIIQDEGGFIAGVIEGRAFRGSFESLCDAHRLIGEMIAEVEDRASFNPEDYLPEPR